MWQVRVCAYTGRGHFRACPKLVRGKRGGLPLLRCLVMVRYKFVNRNSSSVIILLPFIVLLLLLLLLPPSGLKFSCHFNSTVVLVLLHVKAASQRCYHISLLLLILLQLSLLLLPLPPPLLLLLLRLLLQLFNALLFMLSALMRIPVAPRPLQLHSTRILCADSRLINQPTTASAAAKTKTTAILFI